MQPDNIITVPITEIIDFEAQPFKVVDDDAMTELVESIKTVGVLTPLIARKLSNGELELISGHRRKRACQLAGIENVPVIVKELNNSEAAIMLVDSNLQRDNLLPSEKAFAYLMKLNAIKHQGKKLDISEDCLSLGESTTYIGLDISKSGRQIRRYIRLTELIYPLLDKVDNKIISVTAGAEISFISVRMQVTLNDRIEFYECKLNIKQAEQVKKLYLEGKLNELKINDILSKSKIIKKDKPMLNIEYSKLKKYFPNAQSTEECEAALWELLENSSTKHCA